GLGEDAYPPRADVGRYLADGFDRVSTSARETMGLELCSEDVTALSPSGDGWSVSARRSRKHDEVLIATGHVPSWAGALASMRPPPDGLLPRVFPVERELSSERIPAGATVFIRGFALTMIDAALALTEGRGGTFREGREPYLLRYEPGYADAGLILPWSRTGRPMLAKPDPAQAFRSIELDRIAAEGRSELAASPTEPPLPRVIRTVAKAAAESLAAVAPGPHSVEDLRHRLERAVAGQAPAADISPEAEIERSLAVAARRGAPGPDWALAHAWRTLYPTLVECLGANGLDSSEWPAFRLLASEMERIAFGPPPVNAAKLLALIECGKVDLSELDRKAAPASGLVIDAVLPGPGVAGVHHPLIEQVIRDRHVRVSPGRRGLELTPDVTCVGADGTPSLGLGAIGRPTEDWVIGNDTLNRELHPQPDQWARRVAARARDR
ncbi:MAG: FAD/NAD(P)-binding protein, partial [Actinomycetota bacterium]|nr:FAD/NAD(P)-binding protein [Actinomycetota bacterium]